MAWIFNDEKPIYLQMTERIERMIAAGEYKPGESVMSVRELALQAAVNPNTAQRAMSELERRGLLATTRNMPRCVTCDIAAIENMRERIILEAAEAYAETVCQLHADEVRALETVRDRLNKKKKE